MQTPSIRNEGVCIATDEQIGTLARMIIYQTSKGKGFNPFFPMNRLLASNGNNVFMLNAIGDTASRTLAYLNVAVSVMLLIVISILIATDTALSNTDILLGALFVLAWRMCSFLARHKTKMRCADPVYDQKFAFCLYTFEWSLVYLSITLFLLYIRADDVDLLLNGLLAFLAGLSAVMLFMPLAQGSTYLLIRRDRRRRLD
ncbi:MAG: hypothetical protein CMQ34_01505 [Gammaproteobacteria bacterium]|nr:hypothetical protein [Gammaproteobacteria bacterium]|tara:strand:- start:139 stop:741 length:603 start_codon:yes stop_codon:yes gene_type:complete